jgi:hypothetical protein
MHHTTGLYMRRVVVRVPFATEPEEGVSNTQAKLQPLSGPDHSHVSLRKREARRGVYGATTVRVPPR